MPYTLTSKVLQELMPYTRTSKVLDELMPYVLTYTRTSKVQCSRFSTILITQIMYGAVISKAASTQTGKAAEATDHA